MTNKQCRYIKGWECNIPERSVDPERDCRACVEARMAKKKMDLMEKKEDDEVEGSESM